jgi:hypothetical protein
LAKWITREKAKVDRIACPWLITHFVDRDAEFIFVQKEKVKEFAAQHVDEKGNRYDGYEFVIVPINRFSNACQSCGESLVLKCGKCGKTLPNAVSKKETASFTIDTEEGKQVIIDVPYGGAKDPTTPAYWDQLIYSHSCQAALELLSSIS